MTTDITDLAQRMKAAAVRAKAATKDYVAHRMSITVCLEECKEFNDLSDGPDNILALVEALEKAQQGHRLHAARLISEKALLKERIAEPEESNTQVIQSRDHYKRMTEEGLKQLAESRTVTVRMPGSYQTSCSESEKYLCPVDVEQAVLSAGADAGIKIDIKWEDE